MTLRARWVTQIRAERRCHQLEQQNHTLRQQTEAAEDQGAAVQRLHESQHDTLTAKLEVCAPRLCTRPAKHQTVLCSTVLWLAGRAHATMWVKLASGSDSRHLESIPKAEAKQDWILKCLQGGRALTHAACGVATLCGSPPTLGIHG